MYFSTKIVATLFVASAHLHGEWICVEAKQRRLKVGKAPKGAKSVSPTTSAAPSASFSPTGAPSDSAAPSISFSPTGAPSD
eukprot:CAMPEP_0116150220 /NCGR_PEP_ID=MMETSP0329-20121206/19419_1 /TAXON_ID=697910 /ORGANISM="Pseudo-nitzschia arenysensis, Strain B593" /LENGTH=80 /DNA_ID=CAMNT_0003646695 /DNA_START=27 /DNA_END=266 /DNA_ORIENTATION=+